MNQKKQRRPGRGRRGDYNDSISSAKNTGRARVSQDSTRNPAEDLLMALSPPIEGRKVVRATNKAAIEANWLWFVLNPHRKFRLRRIHHGEVSLECDPDATHMLVRLLVPGVGGDALTVVDGGRDLDAYPNNDDALKALWEEESRPRPPDGFTMTIKTSEGVPEGLAANMMASGTRAGSAFWMERAVQSSAKMGLDITLGFNCLPSSAWQKDDRAWFEAHTDRTNRLRRVLPGEEATLGPARGASHVIVMQIAPGERVRSPVFDGGDGSALDRFPDEENYVMALYEVGLKSHRISLDDAVALAMCFAQGNQSQ